MFAETLCPRMMGALNDLHCFSLLCYRSDTVVGSGSVVSYNGKFHFLTVGHIFLTRKKGGQLKYLNDDDVQKMKENCKLVQYRFSAKDFMSTVALPAAVVLKNYDNPKLVFDKVGTVAFSIEL